MDARFWSGEMSVSCIKTRAAASLATHCLPHVHIRLPRQTLKNTARTQEHRKMQGSGQNSRNRWVFRSLVAIAILVVLFFIGRPIYWKISAAMTESTRAPAEVVNAIVHDVGIKAEGAATAVSDAAVEGGKAISEAPRKVHDSAAETFKDTATVVQKAATT